MNVSSLNTEDKVLLARAVLDIGFSDAINHIFNKVDMKKHEYILNELSLRHTAWTGLINKDEINTSIVIETGIGACVEALSRSVDYVYAIYLDNETKIIVEDRVQNNNIGHYLIDEFYEHDIVKPEKTLLVAYNDLNSEFINKIIKNILNSKNIKYYYYIHSLKLFTMTSIYNIFNNSTVYHIEGSIRDPFKLTSQENKIRQFGILKYYIFNMYSRYKKKYIATTNLNLNNSLFCSVANNMFGVNQYNILDIFFVKPNGVLLVILKSNKHYMLRVTSDDLGKKRLANNNKALMLLEEKGFDYAPKLCDKKNIYEYSCSIEERINGRNVNCTDINNQINKENIYLQANKKLINFHKLTLSNANLNDDLYNNLIKKPILKASSFFSNKFISIFEEIECYLSDCLLNKSLPLVLYHGDFSVDNLMIKDNVITGIIDWEYSLNNALPLIDLVFLFCNVYKKNHNVSIVRAMREIVINDNMGVEEKSHIKRYCNSLNVDDIYIKPLSLMCIIYFMVYRLEINSKISSLNVFDLNFGVLLESISSELKVNNQ